MKDKSIRPLRGALVLLSVLAAACADDPNGPAGIGSVELVQRNADLEIGEATTLNVKVLDLRGRPMPAQVTWSSSDPAVATVAAGGSVAAVGFGTAWITVTSGEKRDSAKVTVIDPIATLAISEHDLALSVGASHRLAAEVRDSKGRVRNDVNISWTTTDAMVAYVSAGGEVTANFPGTAIIRAAAGSKSDSAIVVVDAPIARIAITPSSKSIERGESVQLQARVFDVLDRVRSDVPVQWSSEDPTVVHVSQSGVVTGLKYGASTKVTATAAGKSASAFVFVNSKPVENFRYEFAFDLRFKDGTRAEIRAGGLIPLHAGFEMTTGQLVDFGTADVRYDRLTVVTPEGSGCTATTEVHTGKLSASFTLQHPDHQGSYVGAISINQGGPREVIHWNCKGSIMIQPASWLSQVVEEVYGASLITGLQSVAPGRRERKYDRVHDLTIGTVTEKSTFSLERVP